MKRFGWIVALIAATTDTVAVASTCPAFVWLGRDAETRDTFFFGVSGTCESIEINAIEVAPIDRRNEPTCVVHTSSPEMHPVLAHGWKYGALPDGFVERRKCEPLELGRTYEISVFGSCVGHRFFRVDRLGHLRISTSLKGKDLRCGPPAGPGHL